MMRLTRFGFGATKLFVFALSAWVLGACVQTPEPINFQRISVSVGPCNGVCPEYSLSVDENGTAAFLGKRNTVIRGGRSATLSAKNFTALKAAIAAANIATLQSDYTLEANCPMKNSGQSELHWQIEVSGVSKEIRQNLGCASAPDANGASTRLPPQLDTLFKALLETTAADAWIKATTLAP